MHPLTSPRQPHAAHLPRRPAPQGVPPPRCGPHSPSWCRASCPPESTRSPGPGRADGDVRTRGAGSPRPRSVRPAAPPTRAGTHPGRAQQLLYLPVLPGVLLLQAPQPRPQLVGVALLHVQRLRADGTHAGSRTPGAPGRGSRFQRHGGRAPSPFLPPARLWALRTEGGLLDLRVRERVQRPPEARRVPSLLLCPGRGPGGAAGTGPWAQREKPSPSYWEGRPNTAAN